MPYLRLTADRRGFENTFLMHVAAPGESPRVLYWYRTAPGVRIGRPALDDAAMRSLEEQYPGIDFDWSDILDSASMTPVEVEAQLPQRKKKPRRPESEDAADDADADEPRIEVPPPAAPVAATAEADDAAAPALTETGVDLLADLLGRGIATSLRERHRSLLEDIGRAVASDDARVGWRRRLAALDPDGWSTAEAVLAGMASIDATLEEIRRQLDACGPDALASST